MMRYLAFLLILAALPASACGPNSDCMVGDRSYRLYLPETEGPAGAFLFAHGYRGSGEGAMRNGVLRRLADQLGMAFVALDSRGPDWALAHTPQAPDREEDLEFDYVAAVLDDLPARFDLDPARVVGSGFSAGGMLTWTLACGMSERFAGFVPMAGTFWAPVPETCAAPPSNLVHIHGTADRTVPLAGRPIRETRQGDVPTVLAMYRDHGRYETVGIAPAPAGMTCERAKSETGRILEFCTFDGGHSFSVERLRYGIERVLEGLAD